MEKTSDNSNLEGEIVAPVLASRSVTYPAEWGIGEGGSYPYPEQLELNLGLTTTQRRRANAHIVAELLLENGIVPKYLSNPLICGAEQSRLAEHVRRMAQRIESGL